MSKNSGSVLGGMLLIAGSCIGVGMLALPILTGLAGFVPSLFMLGFSWAFMTASALLFVEVNSWFGHQVNFLTMAESTLGKPGRVVCFLTYIFLFYAVLVAYISGIGNLSTTFFQNILGIALLPWVGSLFFVLIFGWIVYLGTRRVDLCNRGLMVGKITSFLLLVFVGASYIRPTLLTYSAPKYTLLSLPLLIIAFGFHNMIPSLVTYLKGDIKRVRFTIIGGSLIAFAIYLIWEILVLGIVPVEGNNGLIASLHSDKEAAQALTALVATPLISLCAQALAFFAILTSFIAQSLSLVHFLADGLHKVGVKETGTGKESTSEFIAAIRHTENGYLCLLALGPPLVLSLIYPQLFFKALNFAGGICTVILFGILPVAMVWIGRYKRRVSHSYRVMGGKWTLACVFFISLSILILQVLKMSKASFIPIP